MGVNNRPGLTRIPDLQKVTEIGNTTDKAMTMAGDLTINGTARIVTATDTDLILLPNGTGITKIGDAGACTFGTPVNDDMCVTGRLQVLGTSDLVGAVVATGTVTCASVLVAANQYIAASAASKGAYIPDSFSQSPRTHLLATGALANSLILCEYADISFNFGHAQQPTPTFFGQSNHQSKVEYWSKTHDGSNAVYGVGHGGHTFTTQDQKARGTMTVAGLPNADETFVIDGQTITFKADGSGDVDHCTIGTGAADQVLELVATLAECTNHADFTAWDGAGDTVVYDWGTAGVAGNAIVFTEAATNITVDGAGTLGTTHAGVAAATLATIKESGVSQLEGAVHIKETATPTAVTNYGAFYPKADNLPYFQDGAGVEHILTTGAADYAEMGNTTDADEVLTVAAKDYAMYSANINATAPHVISGFTFQAGSVGSGTTTTADAGNSINIADGTHGLATGDFVTVQSTNHNGIGTVLYVDADNFEVDISWVADEAITWQMGSYIKCATAGVYRGMWSGSINQSLNNTQTNTVSPVLNATKATKATSTTLLNNNSDYTTLAGNGIMSFAVDDRIWFVAQSTAAQTLTFKTRNVSIR